MLPILSAPYQTAFQDSPTSRNCMIFFLMHPLPLNILQILKTSSEFSAGWIYKDQFLNRLGSWVILRICMFPYFDLFCFLLLWRRYLTIPVVLLRKHWFDDFDISATTQTNSGAQEPRWRWYKWHNPDEYKEAKQARNSVRTSLDSLCLSNYEISLQRTWIQPGLDWNDSCFHRGVATTTGHVRLTFSIFHTDDFIQKLKRDRIKRWNSRGYLKTN